MPGTFIGGVCPALLLPPHHRPKENDQDADGDEGERGASEKLRRPIETLAAPGLHESDERQDEPDGVIRSAPR
jgi:hypothetical protein